MSFRRFQARHAPFQAEEARSLWQKYRNATLSLPGPIPPPIDQAAYAEDRLRGGERARMEAYLARHPDALADVIAARSQLPKRKYFVSARAGLGWGASLCGFVLALWLGFTTGQQLANTEEIFQNLYPAGGESHVNL